MRRLTFIVLILVAASCKTVEPDQPKTTPKIQVKDPVEVATTTLGPSGGTVDVSTGGMAGLEISVPDSAFSDSRTYHIETSEIISHEFGPDFVPASPLIRISNGGGMASKPMLIRIP